VPRDTRTEYVQRHGCCTATSYSDSHDCIVRHEPTSCKNATNYSCSATRYAYQGMVGRYRCQTSDYKIRTMSRKLTCKCGQSRQAKGTQCIDCHAAYMRKNRCRYSELSPEQKRKANCRSYTNMLIRRGKLKREGCQKCGSKAQAHHPDYSNPRLVIWLCRTHHQIAHETK
jgi:hypothetical protein